MSTCVQADQLAIAKVLGIVNKHIVEDSGQVNSESAKQFKAQVDH